MSNVYNEIFHVRGYEIDPQTRATIQTIANFLQEAAGNHAMQLGFGVEYLFKNQMTWVLSRLHIQMEKFPKWRQAVEIETWPSGAQGKFATRDFLVLNSDKNIFGRATTSWMMLDLKSGKPMNMPDFIMNFDRAKRERAIDDKFDKLAHLSNSGASLKFRVRLSDLDVNYHVNNVVYIEWAIESVPQQIREKFHLSQFEISFRAESRHGDEIVSEIQKNAESEKQTIFLHTIHRQQDERELAVARSVWKKR